MRSFHLQALAALCTSGALATRLYTISNECPLPINLLIGKGSQGPLASGANVTLALAENVSTIIFTDANGSNSNSVGMMRAEFYVEGVYVIVSSCFGPICL
jgi:hypothetical protein